MKSIKKVDTKLAESFIRDAFTSAMFLSKLSQKLNAEVNSNQHSVNCTQLLCGNAYGNQKLWF
jgi:hypothetical protein